MIRRHPGQMTTQIPETAMKTPGLLILTSILGVGSNHLDAQIALGVRGGVTQSTLGVSSEHDFVEGTSAKYGALGAVSLTLPVNKLLGLTMEIGYTQRGAELTILDIDALYDVIWGYDYVDVALLGRASFGPAYLLAGPTLALRVACYTKISVKGSCESARAVYRQNDFLLTGGAGVGLDIGSVTLVAEGLYDLGLLDINDSEAHTTAKHRGFVLRVGVDLRLR